MRGFYANAVHHARLMTALAGRLGHDLLARAEAAKIAVCEGGDTRIDLARIEPGLALALELTERVALRSLDDDVERIIATARQTVVQAGLEPDRIDALYFTGGSTGLRLLTRRASCAATASRASRPASACMRGLGLARPRRPAERVRARARPPSPARWLRRSTS